MFSWRRSSKSVKVNIGYMLRQCADNGQFIRTCSSVCPCTLSHRQTRCSCGVRLRLPTSTRRLWDMRRSLVNDSRLWFGMNLFVVFTWCTVIFGFICVTYVVSLLHQLPFLSHNLVFSVTRWYHYYINVILENLYILVCSLPYTNCTENEMIYLCPHVLVET